MVDFIEIYNVCTRKEIIEAVKRIINSDKMWCSYSDLNFGITFFGTQCTFILKTSNATVHLYKVGKKSLITIRSE